MCVLAEQLVIEYPLMVAFQHLLRRPAVLYSVHLVDVGVYC